MSHPVRLHAPPASDSVAKVGQESYTLLLRSMHAVTQRRVAEVTCMAESQLSEFKSCGHLEMALKIAAACGLRLVPTTERTLADEDLAALKSFARRGLEQLGRNDDRAGGAE